MRELAILLTLGLVASSFGTAADLVITPTTTLTQESGNNTSTADGFLGQSNGNIPPSNISKVSMKSLLYPGATTKLYAHLVTWFGPTSHVPTGYSSDDPAQVRRQLDDMQSRGIDGVIIDWYGPSRFENNGTLLVMQEAERRPGFEFAVMEDQGALKQCAATAGCDVTAKMISDLNYVYATYQASPAYMRVNGRPVVFFFDVQRYAIDWTRVRAGVPGNPLFISRNPGAYTLPQSNGSFVWIEPKTIMPTPDYMGLDYLDYHYGMALKYPTMLTYGSAYKGFDDTIAAWSADRHIAQNCGLTWLQTFREIGKFYSSANQLRWIQLVTWNDYEEGTPIETGIDNCVSVSASLSGTTLGWSLSGNESTVHHYTVFISTDGENLMPLGDFAPGTRSLDLSSYSLPAGAYRLYVKAVGQPSLANKISGAVPYTVAVASEVAIKEPAEGAAVTSPVRVVASATSSKPITTMQIYSADYVLAYQGSGSAVDTSLKLAPGAYRLVVQAWDSSGGTFKKAVNITVVNQPPLAALNATPTLATGPVPISASMSGSSDPDGTLVSSSIGFGDGTVKAGGLSAPLGHTYAYSGTYTVTGTVTDDFGASAKVERLVTINPGVRVTSPISGSTVTSQVRVVGSAVAPTRVVAMQIYVDGKLRYQQSSSAIDTTLSLALGTRSLVVQAWDSAGRYYKQFLTVKVGKGLNSRQVVTRE